MSRKMKKRLLWLAVPIVLACAGLIYAGAGIETYSDDTTVKDAIQTLLVDDLTELFTAVDAIEAGSGVLVSSNDSTVGYINGKLVAGEGIDLTEGSDGGNETLTISGEDASTSNKGILETATDAETQALTATDKAVTPGNLGALDASTSQKGIIETATDAETIAMSATDKAVTPGNLSAAFGAMFQYSRPQFAYVDTDTITIGPGGCYLYGKGWCYWTSNITFDLGSGGSNANSDDLTASEWHYIAIDYSTVSAAGTLTASNFINRRAANVTPDYSGTKGGVYQDTDDRTIFGVLTNGSSQLLEFFHDGGEQVNPADHIQEHSGEWPDSWTDLTVSAPAFCTKVLLNAYGGGSGGSSYLYFRVNGQTGTTGIQVIRTGSTMENTVPVFTDSSQIVEYKEAADSSATGSIYMNGWFFPAGM